MLTPEMQSLIKNFPLGFVATVTPDGLPAVSPKGTFLVLGASRLAFADIRSPGTRRNLAHNPAVEVNFIDPFRRVAVRVKGQATLHQKGSDWFNTTLPQWEEAFGDLVRRIGTLVEIEIDAASEIWTPPYDDGATEAEMIALYKDKYSQLYP